MKRHPVLKKLLVLVCVLLCASLLTTASASPVITGPAYWAVVQGFQSNVMVTIYTNHAGVITDITADCSNETPGFGTRCAEDAAFLNQFIGQTAPVQADVLSGATITSNAIIMAVNSALPQPTTTVSASAMGLLSEVFVTVTLNADGTIAAIDVDASGETLALAQPCTEMPFLSQFIGQKGPFLSADVVAGATSTSNAVINALNSLFPAEILTASSYGLLSNVTVTFAVNADGTIAAIDVDASGETLALAQPCTEMPFLSQFIGQKGPFLNADVVAGATYTSNAVINAINTALASAGY